MYIRYPQTGSFKRNINDPLKYLDTVQEKLDIQSFKIKDISFEKKSRICRNTVIKELVDLVHKYEIRGYFWGLMAARPAYYFYPLLSQLEGFYNFDFCEKKKFKFLQAQMRTLSNNYPYLDIKAFNEDIFNFFNKSSMTLPSIIELDGMKTLSEEQIEKIKWIVKEKLPNDKKVILSVTSTIGRVKGYSQEYYENVRHQLKKDLQNIRDILEHQSIEYAEPRTNNGPHYPMRVENFIFNKAT